MGLLLGMHTYKKWPILFFNLIQLLFQGLLVLIGLPTLLSSETRSKALLHVNTTIPELNVRIPRLLRLGLSNYSNCKPSTVSNQKISSTLMKLALLWV